MPPNARGMCKVGECKKYLKMKNAAYCSECASILEDGMLKLDKSFFAIGPSILRHTHLPDGCQTAGLGQRFLK